MNKDEKKRSSKVLSIICTVLTVIIVAITAGILINMIYWRAKNKPVSFFGMSFAIVQTASMEPYIMTGDLIVFHSCDYSDVKVGDYVVFVAGDGFGKLKGQNIVHEAIEIMPDGGIRTKGKNEKTNKDPDKDLVTAENLLGICTSNSAGWGKVFGVISKYGILIIIALVAVPFIISQIIKICKLAKKRDDGENEQISDEIGEPFVVLNQNEGEIESDSSQNNIKEECESVQNENNSE